jgi:hypothetical protein
MGTLRFTFGLVALLLVTGTSAATAQGLRDRLADALVQEAVGSDAPEPGRALFEAVLQSDLFLHEAVGPLDVYLYLEDGFEKKSKAKKQLTLARKGLEPLAKSLEAWFPGEQGVIAGHRFPVVLTHADLSDKEQAFDRVLALLDLCEDGGYSQFKPDLPVFDGTNRAQDDVFTWEVVLCNLGHEQISEQGKKWAEHGLGYAVINMLVNRLFARGAWGPPPPWLKDGLVDELDITSYGEAWIAAGESVQTTSKTRGWSNKGWSGFVPQGSSPPPPVLGPPPGLRASSQKMVVSDKWMTRRNSTSRHWSDLSKDLREDVPASFRNMAAGQSFEKRDRAYSRCVLNLLIGLTDEGGTIPLLSSMDEKESRLGLGGIRTADPLPVLVADSLGGLPMIDELEELSMGDFLEQIERRDLIDKITSLGGGGMLDIADHRKQSAWLYHQRLDGAARQKLYELIVRVENFQQLQEWEVIGDALDHAATSALSESKRFPTKARDRAKVVEAFREALASGS